LSDDAVVEALPVSELGRGLIVLGAVIAAIGVLLVLVGRVPWLGRLPGDISIQRGNWSFYFPLGTSIVLSIILTLVLWLIGRR
jgi:hypothetical protein